MASISLSTLILLLFLQMNWDVKAFCCLPNLFCTLTRDDRIESPLPLSFAWLRFMPLSHPAELCASHCLWDLGILRVSLSPWASAQEFMTQGRALSMVPLQ